MQIAELTKLAKWFKERVISTQVKQKYISLHKKMNETSRQPNIGFEKEKNELFSSLKKIKFSELTNSQMKMLKDFEVLGALGIEGVNNLKGILYENALDMATAMKKIDDVNKNIDRADKELTSILQILNKFVEDETDIDELDDSDVLMRVHFQKDASMNNIVNFKDLSAKWYDIGRGICMVYDESPESVKVVGAQKGSIIIELAAIAAVATCLSEIIVAVLNVVSASMEVQIKAKELKDLGVPKDTVKALEDNAKEQRNKGVENILKDMSEKLELTPEKENFLKKSIKNLMDFTINGGEVDFVSKTEDEENKEYSEKLITLKENRDKIRAIENKIKLLENKDK